MKLGEKLVIGTLAVIALGLLLTHPSGDKAIGSSLGSIYTGGVGALYNTSGK